MSQMWSHGLFGCFSDCGLCVITYIVPCYTAGKNAEAAGEACLTHAIFSLIPLVNIYCHALIRGKIREQKGIDGTFLNDLILAFCCPLCTYVQEAQEVKAPAPLAMARE